MDSWGDRFRDEIYAELWAARIVGFLTGAAVASGLWWLMPWAVWAIQHIRLEP